MPANGGHFYASRPENYNQNLQITILSCSLALVGTRSSVNQDYAATALYTTRPIQAPAGKGVSEST